MEERERAVVVVAEHEMAEAGVVVNQRVVEAVNETGVAEVVNTTEVAAVVAS